MENIDNKQSEARQRNLLRFVHAQDNGGIYEGTATYAEALQEVNGINGREEAKAYIEHPILRDRLVEISEAVLNNEKSVYDIFGQDAIKVRACILLFASVCDIPVFKQLKSKYRW